MEEQAQRKGFFSSMPLQPDIRPCDKNPALKSILEDMVTTGIGAGLSHTPGPTFLGAANPAGLKLNTHPITDIVFSPRLLEENRLPTCSKDELAEAILLGTWEVHEDAGMEFTFSKYNGKTYLLDYKPAAF